jgi:hypothetical protein
MSTLNPNVTERQEYLRELVSQLQREERPLTQQDLLDLQHFVKVVRHEVVEQQADPTTGQHAKATRVNYYRLNERGLTLYYKWMTGQLDPPSA